VAFQALMGSLTLAFANAFLKPLMLLLTLPVTVLTLGIFVFVVNAIILQLVAATVKGVRIRSFSVAFKVALLFSFLNMLISTMIVDDGTFDPIFN